MKKAKRKICLALVLISLCSIQYISIAENNEKQYLLMSGEEYREIVHNSTHKQAEITVLSEPAAKQIEEIKESLRRIGYTPYNPPTTDDVEGLTESCKQFVRDNYDVAFQCKSKRTNNVSYIIFGYESGLALKLESKYELMKYGEVLSGK